MAKKEDQRTQGLLAFVMPFDMVFFCFQFLEVPAGETDKEGKKGIEDNLRDGSFQSKQQKEVKSLCCH